MSTQLKIALWIGERLPFRWAPIWLNNRLARWMWRVPGFDTPIRQGFVCERRIP